MLFVYLIKTNQGVRTTHKVQPSVINNILFCYSCYQDREDSVLHRFYEEIMNSGGDFLEKLNAMPNVTLFAPSNAAFNDQSIQSYLTNRTYIRSLLELHIVNRRLSVDDIVAESIDKVCDLQLKSCRYTLILFIFLSVFYLFSIMFSLFNSIFSVDYLLLV